MTAHWISLVLLVCCGSARAQVTGAQTPRNLTRVAKPDFVGARQLIQQWMAKDSVPGLAIAVARGDSVLWEEGFGWADRDARVPATTHTPFYLASVTKTITATALMLLHQRGRLDLDRPANEYLGGVKLWSPAWDPAGATLRRLAMHTAGLATFDIGGCSAQQPRCSTPSSAELIRRYGVLVSPPGDRYDYSNLGYLVLGEAIERTSGRDFGSFLRSEIFRPLGMHHSSFGVDPTLRAQTAVQYHWVQGPLREPPGPLSGGSSAYASAHDLLLFGQMHAKVRRTGMRDVLTHAAIDSMQHPSVRAGSSERYGLGWSIEENRFGYRSLLAQGGTPSSSAWLRVIPTESIVVVVLANKGVGFPGDVIDEVLGTLLPLYAERRAAQLAAQGASPLAASTTTTLDSVFVGSWTGIIRADTARVPIVLAILSSGSVRGTIGARQSAETSGSARVCCGGVLLRVSIPGDIFTPENIGGPVTFYLRLRDGTLMGHVTTRPDPVLGLDGRVSYWVQVEKQPTPW